MRVKCARRVNTCPFRKLHPAWIRIVRQNHRIIECDVCNPARARNVVADLFKSRSRLEAENLLLRHQLTIALRQAPPRLRLRGGDRAFLIWMTRLWPSLVGAVQVVQPETILRWHRAGFKMFWRWKSRHRAGRPRIDRGLRDLIGKTRCGAHPGFMASS